MYFIEVNIYIFVYMEIKLNETVRERQGILIGIFICFNYLYFNFIFICGNTASEKIYRHMLD